MVGVSVKCLRLFLRFATNYQPVQTMFTLTQNGNSNRIVQYERWYVDSTNVIYETTNDVRIRTNGTFTKYSSFGLLRVSTNSSFVAVV